MFSNRSPFAWLMLPLLACFSLFALAEPSEGAAQALHHTGENQEAEAVGGGA